MDGRGAAYVLGAVVLVMVVGSTGHIPGVPATDSNASVGNDCQATIVATDGTPPPGAPQLDPQKLCDALGQAEKDVACVGDWSPPDPINARQFCIELHQRDCGDPQQNCNSIPADQTYYTHH